MKLYKDMNDQEKATYRHVVYELLFYNNKKWLFDGQSVFFNGQLIHYSDFMKARRGTL